MIIWTLSTVLGITFYVIYRIGQKLGRIEICDREIRAYRLGKVYREIHYSDVVKSDQKRYGFMKYVTLYGKENKVLFLPTSSPVDWLKTKISSSTEN